MPRMWGLDPDQYRNMPAITDIARKVIATQMVTRSQPGVTLRCGASPDSVGSVMWSIVLELPHTALSAVRGSMSASRRTMEQNPTL